MGFTSHGPTRSKSTYRDGVCGSHSHLIPRMYSLPASTSADTSPGNAPERQRGRTAIPAAWVLVEEYRARTCLGAFLGRAATAGNNLAAAPARRRIDHQSEPRNGRAFCARKVDIVLRSRLLAQKRRAEYVVPHLHPLGMQYLLPCLDGVAHRQQPHLLIAKLRPKYQSARGEASEIRLVPGSKVALRTRAS